MGNAVPTLSFSILFEQFPYLEKQHNEHSLRKFRLSTRKKSDAQGSDGRYRHQKILIEQIPFKDTLSRLLKSSETNQQIRYKIYDKQLPHRKLTKLLDTDGADEQDRRYSNKSDFPFHNFNFENAAKLCKRTRNQVANYPAHKSTTYSTIVNTVDSAVEEVRLMVPPLRRII